MKKLAASTLSVSILLCSSMLATAALPAGKAKLIVSHLHSINPSISNTKQCNDGKIGPHTVLFDMYSKTIKLGNATITAIKQTKIDLLNGMRLVNGHGLITVTGPAPYRSSVHWYGIENKGSNVAYGALSDNVCSGNYVYYHGPKPKKVAN